MTQSFPSADEFVSLLTKGEAWIGFDRVSRNPYIYLGVGESRYYVKKVVVFNEETKKTESKWIAAPAPADVPSSSSSQSVPTESKAKIDPAMVEAYKQLLKENLDS